MDEAKGRSLTRREFEAVIKRASEFATSDPDGGEGALDEAELFRIAHEVGLPDAHVRRALTEIRTAENPQGVIARWFGYATVRVSRVVPGEKERLRLIIDEFLVAGHLLQPVRQGARCSSLPARGRLDLELRPRRRLHVADGLLGFCQGDRGAPR